MRSNSEAAIERAGRWGTETGSRERSSSPARRLARLRAVVFSLAALCALVSSCESGSGSSATTTVSPPAHPALVDPPGRTGATGGKAAAGTGALPPDHPPISRPTGAPGAQPATSAGGGGGAGAATGAEPAAGGSVVERLGQFGLTCKLPQGWIEEAPSSSMRLGQARLPGSGGQGEDGEVSIMPAMGSLEANVKRWSEQFTEKPEPVVTDRTVNGVKATIVELEGTFTAGGPMMKSAGGPQAGTKLIGVIVGIPGQNQLLFFKAWGPRATMERWKPSFEELVASLRPTN